MGTIVVSRVDTTDTRPTILGGGAALSFERPGARIDRGGLALAVRAFVEAPQWRARVDGSAPQGPFLDRVAIASATLEAARECLDEAVREARAAGASWVEIGQVLGITRQAAFQRFGQA